MNEHGLNAAIENFRKDILNKIAGEYAAVIRELDKGVDPEKAIQESLEIFSDWYTSALFRAHDSIETALYDMKQFSGALRYSSTPATDISGYAERGIVKAQRELNRNLLGNGTDDES